MANELFLDHDGEISGPYSPSELKRMASNGEIGKYDFIRKGMDGKPVQADSVKGLFATQSTELASVKPKTNRPPAPPEREQSRELARVKPKTSRPPAEPEPEEEPERNITGEILSKTWSGLVATGKATANIVAVSVRQLRTKPTNLSRPSSDPPQFITPTIDRAMDVADCPFCGEEIKAIAKKCKHCGEILDVVLRSHAQPQVAPQAAPHAQPVINIVNTNTAHAHAAVNGRGSKHWSPFVAVCLSLFIPGLGQLYKGQFLNAIAWFIFVLIGYAALIVPGVILHFCCLIGAASGDPYR